MTYRSPASPPHPANANVTSPAPCRGRGDSASKASHPPAWPPGQGPSCGTDHHLGIRPGTCGLSAEIATETETMTVTVTVTGTVASYCHWAEIPTDSASGLWHESPRTTSPLHLAAVGTEEVPARSLGSGLCEMRGAVALRLSSNRCVPALIDTGVGRVS